MDFLQTWKNKSKKMMWAAGTAVGVLFLLLAFFDGQFTDMYRKAVMICLECIGIG